MNRVDVGVFANRSSFAFNKSIDFFPSIGCLKGFQWKQTFVENEDVVRLELCNELDVDWFVDVDVKSSFSPSRRVKLSGDDNKFSVDVTKVENGRVTLDVVDYRGVILCCQDFSQKNRRADFVLLVNDSRFYIESPVLCVYSKYFRALIRRSKVAGKSEARVENISSANFRAFLNLIYPFCYATINGNNCRELSTMSTVFACAKVRNECANFIRNNWANLGFNLNMLDTVNRCGLPANQREMCKELSRNARRLLYPLAVKASMTDETREAVRVAFAPLDDPVELMEVLNIP